MAEREGFDARAKPEASASIADRQVEKRRATLKKITLSAPAGSNKVKMKNLKGKFTCNLEIYNFYGDF